jgi:hypothetical protein
VVSSCFGAYWASAGRWAEHTRLKCGLPVHIISVDGAHPPDGFGDGVFVHPPPAHSTSLRDAEIYRLEFIGDKLASGISCVQMDTDVLLLRGIADLFDIEADFIASRALRLPEFMASKFGFVACMGFFIAKPRAADLCLELADLLRARRDVDNPAVETSDQYLINKLFFDEILGGAMKPFAEASSSGGALGGPYLVSEYRGTRVAILATNTILRGGNLGWTSHGVHHPAVRSVFGRGETN